MNLNSSLTTAKIIEQSVTRPIFLMKAEELNQVPVSTKSLWGDNMWSLDHDLAGASGGESKFRWSIEFEDGQKLTDKSHANMLDWMKRLIWSLFAAPAAGAGRISHGNLGQLSTGFRYFLPWLVSNHLEWPEDLNHQVLHSYLADISYNSQSDGESKIKLSYAQVYIKLRPLHLLWQQRFVLERAGIKAMPIPPFGRSNAHRTANKIIKSALECYRPLPDEVAIPVLNSAMRMLEIGAEDVINLAHGCVDAYDAGSSERIKLRAQREFINGFVFQRDNGAAWHWPLNPKDWDAKYVKDIRGRLETAIHKPEGTSRSAATGEQLTNLPTVTRVRRYVDVKRLFLDIGASVNDASALAYLPEWRSAIIKRANREGLSLTSNHPAHRVRELVLAVQAAAHLVIQGTTGMRISEIAGLQAGLNEKTNLPLSVYLQDSTSGMGEVFVIKSKLFKTETTPATVEWTLGYRLKGSEELPPAVNAIQIVDRLMAPWREKLKSSCLFINFANSVAFPKKAGSLSAPKSHRMRQTLRDFIEEWVDITELPDNAARPTSEGELVSYRVNHGRNIKTHQLRKLFANFAYRVDAKMLPVLQMHFHHISIGITDCSYIMSDPSLLQEQDDVRHQQAALIALETARGAAPLAGRFGEALEEKIRSELNPRLEGCDAESAYDEAFAYVDEAGLNRLFYEPYGICGAKSASEMACHSEGGTEAIARWSNDLRPNYKTRAPSLCAGCPSFVLARWHLPFWENRYVEYAVSLLVAHANGEIEPDSSPFLKVIKVRMQQAFALAKKLGADPIKLEMRVDASVKEVMSAASQNLRI